MEITITAAQLEVAAKAAATSEYDGKNWAQYKRATAAAFRALGFTVEDTHE